MPESSLPNKYLIGQSRLNKQNGALIRLTMECIQAMKRNNTRNTGAIIKALELYGEEYFTIEEYNLARSGSRDTDKHKTEHEKFMQTIKNYEMRYFDGNPPSMQEIVNFLIYWIKNHILKSDSYSISGDGT